MIIGLNLLVRNLIPSLIEQCNNQHSHWKDKSENETKSVRNCSLSIWMYDVWGFIMKRT